MLAFRVCAGVHPKCAVGFAWIFPADMLHTGSSIAIEQACRVQFGRFLHISPALPARICRADDGTKRPATAFASLGFWQGQHKAENVDNKDTACCLSFSFRVLTYQEAGGAGVGGVGVMRDREGEEEEKGKGTWTHGRGERQARAARPPAWYSIHPTRRKKKGQKKQAAFSSTHRADKNRNPPSPTQLLPPSPPPSRPFFPPP